MSSFNSGASPLPLAAVALRTRQIRNKVFGAELFGDPAWDILLVLRVGGPSNADHLAEATGLTNGTIARWAELLRKDELVSLRGEAYELTEMARTKLEQVFGRVVSPSGLGA